MLSILSWVIRKFLPRSLRIWMMDRALRALERDGARLLGCNEFKPVERSNLDECKNIGIWFIPLHKNSEPPDKDLN